MKPISPSVFLVAAVLSFAACAGKPKPPASAPVTAGIKELRVSPQELRIRVRALIRPVLGTVEESADEMLARNDDPLRRRYLLQWKIEVTTTMLAALLRPDPVVALADAWGYVIQMDDFLGAPHFEKVVGEEVPHVRRTLDELRSIFRDFAGSVQEGLSGNKFEAKVAMWAHANPIPGALYRRPSMSGAVAADLAKTGGGGAFAALGSLEETTGDLLERMDLYTMYLPRLVRWEAELGMGDVLGNVDLGGAMVEVERFTEATAQLADAAGSATDVIPRERAIVLDAVAEERRILLDQIRRERIETLQEMEAIAERLLDRSAGPLDGAAKRHLDDVIQQVEEMRGRLLEDAGPTLEAAIDHAFYRALQLLLVAVAFTGVGMVLYARVLKR